MKIWNESWGRPLVSSVVKFGLWLNSKIKCMAAVKSVAMMLRGVLMSAPFCENEIQPAHIVHDQEQDENKESERACKEGFFLVWQFSFVLFVGNFFQPVDSLSVLLFVDGNVRHGGGGCGAMPMLLIRREPDHIAGANLLDWAAFTLCATAAGGDNECLTERMRGPCGAGARFEGYARTLHARGGR